MMNVVYFSMLGAAGLAGAVVRAMDGHFDWLFAAAVLVAIGGALTAFSFAGVIYIASRHRSRVFRPSITIENVRRANERLIAESRRRSRVKSAYTFADMVVADAETRVAEDGG